jgi:excisionase family DNA binding protein
MRGVIYGDRGARTQYKISPQTPIWRKLEMQVLKAEAKCDFFDPLFKIREVETIIRAGRSTIYKLIRSGALAAVKRGGSTLVTRTAINSYLATAKPVKARA